jgi:hypothetical protein
LSAGSPALYATLTLHNTRHMSRWRSRKQRRELPQVLGDGSKDKLVLGTSRFAYLKRILKLGRPRLRGRRRFSTCRHSFGRIPTDGTCGHGRHGWLLALSTHRKQIR